MTSAIVLVCDRTFLPPTLGTAMMARQHAADTPIFVFVTDADDRALVTVSRALEPYEIDVRAAKIEELGRVQACDFNQTHVPVAAMARLWLDEMLPHNIRRFLYIDGDVEITGPLAPLLALDLPQGGFLAAPDLPMLTSGNRGRTARKTCAYFEGLGLTRPETYFNDGVMFADRGGWRKVGADAWAFFKSNPRLCKYHEQSALNATASDRRGVLSLRWNYQTDFMMVADPRKWGLGASIWHFTGFPKPWHAPALPWRSDFGTANSRGCAIMAETGLTSDIKLDITRIERGVVERRNLDFKLRRIYPWRRIDRERRIHAHLLATWNGAHLEQSGASAGVPSAPLPVRNVAPASNSEVDWSCAS